jgi:glycosyltransferase involved in cell wall biosynthesis
LLSSGVVGFSLAFLLKLSGAKIVFILHNTVWPEGCTPRGVSSWVRGIGHHLVWKYCVWHTLVVSPAAHRQVTKIIGLPPETAPATVFQPTFPQADFLGSPSLPNFGARPFRVLYASRIEKNKGAFDLLAIAQSLPKGQFEFHVCGDGSAIDEFIHQVRVRGLEGSIHVHGRLPRPALLEQYLAAQAVIVPTRSAFEEGFAMVVAEAILLRRPVITCNVVPAAEVLRSAVLLAKVDDIESYVAALHRLSSDEVLYRQLVAESGQYQQLLLNRSASLLASLKALVTPETVLKPSADLHADKGDSLVDGTDT